MNELDEMIKFAESKMKMWTKAQYDVSKGEVERSLAAGMASYFKGRFDALSEYRAIDGGGDD